MIDCINDKAELLSEAEERRIKKNQLEILNQLTILEMEDRIKQTRINPSTFIPTGDFNPCEIGYLCY